ncbi:hypothetical protein E2562_034884 [Oryza meyeriana var. granulata]|uniref:Uncharacterized protein n=1 Tax=Oryza meyeriana var. granulata TaxID=110450 RepID=A0A6G1C1V6_9ORYZ|nr:hypothetical protein E2562_034884 [Oryza meyeriana var. granulata]KAF0894152.1 hypothetical protein E2562_034884 [Oryza meyeriana var. granulata]
MARLLSRTLSLARARPSPLPSCSHRPLRGLSSKVEFIEIDLSEDAPAPSSSSSSGVEGGGSAPEEMGMRRLEDAIHGILVRRAAPDWLHFVPGGSYWVPEMRRGVADLVGAVVYSATGARNAEVMTEEEMMCLTTVRGWPSAEYFVEGEFDEIV